MEWKSHLEQLLKNHLPGERAHIPMAPLNRPVSSLARKEATFYRESAISLIIVEQNFRKEIVLIQRPKYDGNHSGQIAFPGGKKEESDSSLFHTAIRETHEEIGIQLANNQFVGELTPVFIPVSSFHVQPFVFCLSEYPDFIPDSREVDEIFTLSLNDLLDPKSLSTMVYRDPKGFVIRDIPCFSVNGKEIWGATALMLNELKMLFVENGIPL